MHPIHLRDRSSAEEYARLLGWLASLGPASFRQLDREVFVLDDYRRGENGIELDCPSLSLSATLRHLHRQGWTTEEDSDDTAWETTKSLPGGFTAVLTHSPIDVRYFGGRPTEDMGELAVEGSFSLDSLDLEGPDTAKIWEAPPVLFSEVVRDVELAIRAGAPSDAPPSRAARHEP